MKTLTAMQQLGDNSETFHPLRSYQHEATRMRYRILIEQDEDGVFVAEVPSLPGCVSQGQTRKQVIENIKEAITGYIESLHAHGEPIPPSITEEVVEVEDVVS